MPVNYHIPVLLEASLKHWYTRPGGVYVDCTAGGGGHARGLLALDDPDLRLIAIDQDPEAIEQLPDDPRLISVNANFADLGRILDDLGIEQVDGILADLGVSSHHFDTPERGFSFRFDALLDMRMNPKSDIPTAATLLNQASVNTLVLWLREYGEIRQAGRIARAIEERRANHPFERTSDLNALLESFAPPYKRNAFFAQVYQALRIAVNRELETLEALLQQVVTRLRSGGAFVVISYHSLEDRRIKYLLRSGNLHDEPILDFLGNRITPWQKTCRKPIRPDLSEAKFNPRSRSARLRWGIKA